MIKMNWFVCLLTGIFQSLVSGGAGADTPGERVLQMDRIGVEAIPVKDFLNSMGICIHHAQGVSVTSYVAPLNYLGIKSIRDDEGKPLGYIHLRKEAGVRTNLIVKTDSLAASLDTLRQLAKADALLSIEGSNEPNNFPIKYQGKVGGGFARVFEGVADWTPVANFQRDLYAAVKDDPILSKYPVFHTSEAGASSPNVGLQFLTIPQGATTTLPAGTKYADYANVHNYVSSTKDQYVDNQAWNAADPILNGPWDGLYGEYGKTWGHGYRGYSNDELLSLPRVTTETGWDSASKHGGERTQGVVLLNTFLSQFKRGWSYTFIYMLRDGEGGSGNQGVFNADSSPKLAANYIHNFTSVLNRSKENVKPGRLRYNITGNSEATHDLLLQTATNEFALIVWGERVKGSDSIVVEFGDKIEKVDLYDPTLGDKSIKTESAVSGIKFSVSDHPVILQVRRANK